MDSYFCELSQSISPDEILKVFSKHGSLKIKDLRDKDNCSTLTLGKEIGSGRNGKVYLLKDGSNNGLEVVLKKITIVDKFKKDGSVYVFDSSMNEIMMSAFFNQIYENEKAPYSVNFPYFEGFFTCGDQAHIVMERIQTSLYDYLFSQNFKAKDFHCLMFQLCFNLKILANEKIMHNDLHTRNLMLSSTKDLFYKGKSLDAVDAPYLFYQDGTTTYKIPNRGFLLKFVDFDFSARHSNPQIAPTKLIYRPIDKWNVQYRWTPDYDFMTILMFLIDALWVVYPLSSELDKARTILGNYIKHIMTDLNTKHISKTNSKLARVWKSNEKAYGNSIELFGSFFHQDTNRPLPEFENLDLKIDLGYWKYNIKGDEILGEPLVGAI